MRINNWSWTERFSTLFSKLLAVLIRSWFHYDRMLWFMPFSCWLLVDRTGFVLKLHVYCELCIGNASLCLCSGCYSAYILLPYAWGKCMHFCAFCSTLQTWSKENWEWSLLTSQGWLWRHFAAVAAELQQNLIETLQHQNCFVLVAMNLSDGGAEICSQGNGICYNAFHPRKRLCAQFAAALKIMPMLYYVYYWLTVQHTNYSLLMTIASI